MKKAIVTFGVGDAALLLEVSQPTFRRYADTHGYEVIIGEPPASRDVSWRKLPLLIDLFREGYEALVWIDADVAVLRHDRDILDDSPAGLGLVVHNVPEGAVPNCGLIVARWPMGAMLLAHAQDIAEYRAASGKPFRRSAWWEQAAVIQALGGDPDANEVRTIDAEGFAPLPYEWNPHRHDARGIPDNARCFHATMYDDRRGAMVRAVEWSQQREAVLCQTMPATMRGSCAIAAGLTGTMC